MTTVDDYVESMPDYDNFDFMYRKLYKVLEDEKKKTESIELIKLRGNKCKTR
jgi:hypothetical protein